LFCGALGLDIVSARISPINVPLASFATMFDNTQIARYLFLLGCDFHARDDWGRTPLSFASKELSLTLCFSQA
jgi:hypothetical protein